MEPYPMVPNAPEVSLKLNNRALPHEAQRSEVSLKNLKTENELEIVIYSFFRSMAMT
jgi:hypothetical protein